MNAAGTTILVIFFLLIAAVVGWVIFCRMRAQRLGLPPPALGSFIPFRSHDSPYGPPQPVRGGVVGWFNDQVRKFKNRNNRSATGAYEQSTNESYAGGPGAQSHARRGFGPLDPDEAWDARVGAETDPYGPYYEEQEMGPASGPGAGRDARLSVGDGYAMNLPRTPARHSGDISRGPQAGRPATGRNPFDDDDDGISTSTASVDRHTARPLETAVQGSKPRGRELKTNESPTERMSVFRENV